ncbi:hypothetical protein GSI_00101 [Ganoderma sinense ZZ0214-1]|uniref:Uncharacterized protein n=1 Tax=Ganoderma sinense ZZ0214-1 TaxID=1077348 RepID=A0A2G8SRS1_9APHY|nr:hypothetical protein GSI_00101 [Ganoderma sinense ZZ0214-1]
MRFSGPFLSQLAAALVAFSASATVAVVQAAAAAASPSVDADARAPGPQFREVFVGYFDIFSRHNASGPFGTRVRNAMSGGSMWDAATGALVADILPFSDTGLHSASGPFFPEAVVPLVWKEDGHYAAFFTSGVREGNAHLSWEYAHVETDSPAYAWMNSRFFIAAVNSTAAPRLTFTVFEETSS